MGKWVSTIGQKVWHRVRHSFQAAVTHRHGPETVASSSGRMDASQFPEHCPPLSAPLLFSPLMPGSIALPLAVGDQGPPEGFDSSDWLGYLLDRENTPPDINKLDALLRMPQVLLEIGCGNAEAARQIALKNPDMGVIATDLYDWSRPQSAGSGYGKFARQWRHRELSAQMDTPANLVILRAEADLLRCLPLLSIDTVFLLNPEPRVGTAFLALLRGESLFSRIKQGPMQIVILPFSREMGLIACGGCSFDHDSDWSKGLGFIMGSGLRFHQGASIQWGVDLSRISAYTGNSTQRGIYVFGELQG